MWFETSMGKADEITHSCRWVRIYQDRKECRISRFSKLEKSVIVSKYVKFSGPQVGKASTMPRHGLLMTVAVLLDVKHYCAVLWEVHTARHRRHFPLLKMSFIQHPARQQDLHILSCQWLEWSWRTHCTPEKKTAWEIVWFDPFETPKR
jgi:hypothetical protein